jgi:hypothetical protein
MPGLLIAAAVAATVSATPHAPAVHRAAPKPMTFTTGPGGAPPRSPGIQKVCGMPMVIGDASFDPGILIGNPADRRAAAKTPADDSSCGSLKLVKPVKR